MDSPVSGFSHLQLLVTDLTQSEAWYATTLGLRRFAGGPDAGVKHEGLVTSGEGTSLHLRDPDGLAVELITAEKASA